MTWLRGPVRISRLGAILAGLIVGCSIGGSYIYASNRAAPIETVREASLGSCRRLQYLRDDVNRFEGTIYEFLEAARVARLEAARRPAGTADDLRAAGAYAKIQASVVYIPRTDCDAAVDHPLTFVPPQPLPYRDAKRRGLTGSVAAGR